MLNSFLFWTFGHSDLFRISDLEIRNSNWFERFFRINLRLTSFCNPPKKNHPKNHKNLPKTWPKFSKTYYFFPFFLRFFARFEGDLRKWCEKILPILTKKRPTCVFSLKLAMPPKKIPKFPFQNFQKMKFSHHFDNTLLQKNITRACCINNCSFKKRIIPAFRL